MKRKESIVLRAVSAVLVCFVIVYMGYHAVMVFNDPLQTVRAVQFMVEDAIPVDGWFIRDERVIPYPEGYSGHIAEPCVDDGTRVAKDDAVLNFYGDQSALSAGARLRELERRIADMEYVRGVTAGVMDAVHMDMLIFRNLTDMLDARDRRQPAVESGLLEFKSMVFKREYAFGGAADPAAALSRLTAQAEMLLGSRTEAVYTARAPQSGIFTTQVDGYEEFLTPETIKDLTVSGYMELGNMRGAAGQDAGMGKLALDFKWFHAILLPEEEARLLAAGKMMSLRFTGEGDIEFRVERVSEPEDGQSAVVLSSTRGIGDFINIRRLPADLVLRTFSGLRAPKNAIRQDARTGAFGVYCLLGNQIVFKPVTILTERENYYLVAFDPLTASVRDLLPGDEMVVKGKDIYDGKVYLRS